MNNDYPGRDWSGWAQWPSDRPRPTRDDWEAATARWTVARRPGDVSDGAWCFPWLIETYSRWCWWEFFFPNDIEGKRRVLDEALSKIEGFEQLVAAWMDKDIALAGSKRKIETPDPTRPDGWLAIHRAHGRPYRDAKIGVWHTWRCPACGDKFRFTDDDREREPGKFVLE